MPFSGGKRICFGKTFAEAILRLMTVILTQNFEFELVNRDKYGPNDLPRLLAAQSHYPKNPLILKKYIKK